MSKLDDALRFAISAHEGMRRKGDGSAYVFHPLEAASIAATMTTDEDVLCAAALHDVVEDTPFTSDTIREQFGERVAELVASESENKRHGIPSEQTWLIRKQESLEELAKFDDEGVSIVWLADKLSNMRSLNRLHESEGEAMWNHFHQKDPAMHEWYYREIAELTKDLGHHVAWKEHVWLIDQVFGGVEQ